MWRFDAGGRGPGPNTANTASSAAWSPTPPPNVAACYLEQTVITDAGKPADVWMLGGTGPAKIQAVAVAESARGTTSGVLLKRCEQTYQHRGHLIAYGQMPPTSGLNVF